MTWEWEAEAWTAAMTEALATVDEIGQDKARELASTATKRMRQTAPVETGDMRKSIRFRSGKDEQGRYVEFGPLSPVARFTEYGTSRMPARPWLRPAIEQAVREVFG